MYFNNIQLVAAILDSSDKKLILVAKINTENVLHTVRVWLDIGSSCSLVSAWSVTKFGIPKTNLVKKVLARGLGGVEVLSSKCNVCLVVNNKNIIFDALVSHFSIMSEMKIDLLVGQDIIGTKLGLNIPINAKPSITILEDFSEGDVKLVTSRTLQGSEETQDWQC